MNFIEIAGLMIDCIGTLNSLATTYRDLTKWKEIDIEVDHEWLELAIAKKLIDGPVESYAWRRKKRVPTLELKGTHEVVFAFNTKKRLKYRILQGSVEPLVLMRKRETEILSG